MGHYDDCYEADYAERRKKNKAAVHEASLIVLAHIEGIERQMDTLTRVHVDGWAWMGPTLGAMKAVAKGARDGTLERN